MAVVLWTQIRSRKDNGYGLEILLRDRRTGRRRLLERRIYPKARDAIMAEVEFWDRWKKAGSEDAKALQALGYTPEEVVRWLQGDLGPTRPKGVAPTKAAEP